LHDDYEAKNNNSDRATMTHDMRSGRVKADSNMMDPTDSLTQDSRFNPAIFGVGGNRDAEQQHRVEENQVEQHHVEQWLSSNMDPTSDSGSGLGRHELDNWSGLESFLGLPSEAWYDAELDTPDVREDAGQGQSLEGTESYNSGKCARMAVPYSHHNAVEKSEISLLTP
jgi:hypothetical protein